ncbi:hypothetical protein D6856_00425 [Butyrivibrio sp. XB500-5]|uniref:hypothetical protein n=1 Tax=Butyrivibrio sp. XB500-5 TaxID=2364880 RepID=UPI000EA9134E|nr:hypothetical protein [Butyrivibrio sp. XB500-5]RKM62628.1 hypothetical protein D6856_00425 [Butyrivibrio sp. XB500-5]
MFKFVFLSKAVAFVILNASLAFSPCMKMPFRFPAKPPVKVAAVAEPVVQTPDAEKDDKDVEEDLCSSEGINYPENDAVNAAEIPDGMDDPTEDTESESDTVEVKIVDGKIIEVGSDDAEIPDGMDDPTEDTESESDTVEVKIVDGKIIEVGSEDDLVAVPDVDDEEEKLHMLGSPVVFDQDGNMIVEEEMSMLGSPVAFDQDGNVIVEEEMSAVGTPTVAAVGTPTIAAKDAIVEDDEEDLCSSEGINYPENDQDAEETDNAEIDDTNE